MKLTKQAESSTWGVYEITMRIRYIGVIPTGRPLGKGPFEALSEVGALGTVVADKKLIVALVDAPLFKIER